MQILKLLLDGLAGKVFLGTLPLLGSIVLGLLQNDRRLQSMDKRIDSIDQRLGRIEKRLESVDANLAALLSH